MTKIENKQRKILILGAGASGLAAAIGASASGALTTVVEHNSEAGKKLLITGNGRCNYTNTAVSFEHYRCSDAGFVKDVLDGFGAGECIGFFRKIGIEPDIRHYRFDDTGYVYPKNGNARSVRDALVGACSKNSVRFVYDTNAAELGIKKNSHGKFCSALGDFDALIFATGSNAYPATGSDNSVYPLLKSFALGFNGFLPALCGLYSKDERLKKLKGRRIEGNITLKTGNDGIFSEKGEVQFNEHSISGIPVMQLSGYASEALKNKKKCILTFKNKDTGILSFEIYRTAGFDKAQCCRGGIDTSLINPLTMESMAVKGIYICGELADADGECGGYNLHFAWASGLKAGRSAALKHDQN